MKRTIRICAAALALLFTGAAAAAAHTGDNDGISKDPCTMGWPDTRYCGIRPTV